jgi:hypothetical protein
VSDPLPAGRFFGMYLQTVDKSDGERKQFLVLPPITDPSLGSKSGKIVWWERAQFVSSPRPKWNMYWEGGGGFNHFWDRVQHYVTNDGWITAEPVVVKVTPGEVREWVLHGKTPYDFIRRLERRTRLKGIQIQGPTSKPQVVTPPPSS